MLCNLYYFQERYRGFSVEKKTGDSKGSALQQPHYGQGPWWSKDPYTLVLSSAQTVSIILHDTTHTKAMSTPKTLDISGNCQRPVFSLSVSQHTCMHKITNL